MWESQRVYVAGSLDAAQTYDYDEVNRLKAAEEKTGPTSHWKQVYAYDQFGNRTLGAGTTYPSQLDATTNPEISPATNRIASAGYSYDEAGNLLCDPVRPCAQSPSAAYYSYDAENKMKAAAGGFDGGGTTYSYDGDGRRVKKATHNGEVTVFVYDVAGRVVAEYSNQVQYNGTSYLTQDHLGSTRAVTGQEQSVRARHDYLPFGEEISAGVGGRTTTQGYVSDNLRQKFVGSERDGETGLDYMKARYYSSAMGRFTSVDPMPIKQRHLLDPQDLNRYAYVANNPLAYIDPEGLEKIRIIIRTFIPRKTVRAPNSSLIGPATRLSKGDGRNVGEKGNYRTQQIITIETDPKISGAAR